MPFPVRRILMSHPEPSRHSTAIEDSLEASSRSVLPALQAGVRGSDSQEMAGAVNVTARGTVEAGERGGGAAASRFSGCSGRGMGPCSFSQGEGGGRGVAAVGSRGEGLTAGKVALYPSSFECSAFMIKKLCL